MLNLRTGSPNMKRGAAKTGRKTQGDTRASAPKAARILLAAVLSMALAVSPLGLTAFASQSTTVGPQSPEELGDGTNPESGLTIDPGNVELVGDNTYCWPNLTIDAKEPDRLIHSATIQFTSAFDENDEINVTADGDFELLYVRNTIDHGNKTINNPRGATAAEWQQYLRDHLTMELAGEDRTADIRFALSYLTKDRRIYYSKDTGHYYEKDQWLNAVWEYGYETASNHAYNGMQGYYATITSEEEDNFLFSIIDRITWISATNNFNYTRQYLPMDSINDRIYVWMNGPEAGTQIPTIKDKEIYSNWTTEMSPTSRAYSVALNPSSRFWEPRYLYVPAGCYLFEYGGMPNDDVDAASQDDAHVDITFDPNAADNAQDGTEKQLSIDPGKPTFTGTSSITCRWPNLTISTKDPDKLIRSVTIQFTSVVDWVDGMNIGYKPYFEVLPGGNGRNLTINNINGATADVWQQYLRSSLYAQLANADAVRDMRFTLNCSYDDNVVSYCKDTDHFYESFYIGPGVYTSWIQAFEGAQAKQYKGMQGYLATSTSPEENIFIRAHVRGHGWIGATCDPAYVNRWFPDATMSDRVYAWVTGPEAGTQIPPTNDDAEYACWKNGRVDYRGLSEDLLSSRPYVMTWNVETNGGSWEVDNRQWEAYTIEYGGMPGDDITFSSDDEASIDVALDPSGKTLSTSLESSRIEFGDTLKISESINGETVPEDLEITHTFYVEDKEQEGGWRKLDGSELGTNGMPANTGKYKVESHAAYTDDEGNEQQYNPGSAKFTIVPKSIDLTNAGPIATKEYDGTGTFDLSGASLPSGLIGGLDIELDTQSATVSGGDGASAGDKTLALDGSSLKGSDADNYRLNVKVQILPRKLVVTTDANVKKGYADSALKAPDGRGLELSSNLAVRDAGSDGAWLENELAPCDGEIGEDGVLTTILGEETLAAVNAEGNQLDPDRPEEGTYKVGAHYANVNPMDGDGDAAGAIAAAARMADPSDISARLLDVDKVGDWTYDIGNYILTIKPATITIVSKDTGGSTATPGGSATPPDAGSNTGGSGPGSDADNSGTDSENPGSGAAFAPIDATTDIRLDPSSTGTIGDDPYFEYDPDKPVNVLDFIQVKPEDGDDWSNWIGGSDPGTGPDDPDSPGSPGDSNSPGGSDPSNPDGSTSPGGPADGGGSGDGSDDNGTGNGNGSGNGTGGDGTDANTGAGSGDGSGNPSNPDDPSKPAMPTAPQLPDNVKVTVTDETGKHVDPTGITDPGTYEVTVSVKDPDTDEYIVVDTLTFHVVDTSITDTDYIYKDVSKDFWGHDYIFDIGPKVINGCFNPSDVALGYMAGYAGTTNFGPGNGIIRGDAAIVVWRMAGCPDVEADGKNPDDPKLLSLANTYYTGFSDCDASPGMYWNKAISWCAKNGIVEGYGDTGEYRPQNPITREEFASIIARYAAFKGKDVASASADLTQYPDHEDVSAWAFPNMEYVVSNGIMTGKGTNEGTAQGPRGILDPQAHITRAEVAKMAYIEQPSKL